MTKLQCPNVVAAAIRLEEHKLLAEGKELWSLADALVKDCGGDTLARGLASATHANNGSAAKLEAAQRELKAAGIEYDSGSLRVIRDVAISFAKADRVDGLAFWSHKEAGSPEILTWIMKTTPKRERKDRFGIISVITIREKAKQYRQIAAEAKEREHAKAVSKLKDAKRTNDLTQVRKAKDEVEALETMPKSGSGSFKPSESELRNSANTMKIDVELGDALRTLKEALSQLRAVKSINEDYAASFVEDCDKIIAAATHIKNFLSGKSNVHNIKEDKSA